MLWPELQHPLSHVGEDMHPVFSLVGWVSLSRSHFLLCRVMAQDACLRRWIHRTSFMDLFKNFWALKPVLLFMFSSFLGHSEPNSGPFLRV